MPSEGLHQLNRDVILDRHQLQDYNLVFGEASEEVPFEAMLMWGADRQSRLNQTKVSANPQDDCLKQKSSEKSMNLLDVMIFQVENTNSVRLPWE